MKRFISLILTLVMVITALPLNIFAEDDLIIITDPISDSESSDILMPDTDSTTDSALDSESVDEEIISTDSVLDSDLGVETDMPSIDEETSDSISILDPIPDSDVSLDQTFESVIETVEPPVLLSSVIAYGTCGDNLTWKLTDDGTLTISGTGDMDNGYMPWYDYRKNWIFSVVVEDGVTSIGEYSFSECWNLRSITMPEGITSIGSSAFSHCSRITNIIIPESVTTIDSFAFNGCTNLISIEIPERVTSVGWNAFTDCMSLTSIKFMSPVTAIDDYADTISSNATIYGYTDSTAQAYAKKHGRAFISLGDAPNMNFNVASGTCGNNITWLLTSDGTLTISGTGDMYSYYLNAPWESYISQIKTVVISEGVTSIGDGAFWDCSSLSSVTIPYGVISIGGNAFNSCWELTNIVIPDSVTSIGNGAFAFCGKLESIRISKKVTEIRGYTFQGCDNLINLIIPENVITIGDFAFWGCSSLKSISIPSSVNNISPSAFASCLELAEIDVSNSNRYFADIGGVMFNKTLTELLVYPQGKADIKYTIPESVISICADAFSGCRVVNVIIPETLVMVNEYAFAECQDLSIVYFLSPTTEIYDDKWTINSTATIYGYTGSTAEAYAKKYGREFVALDHGYNPDNTYIDLKGTNSYGNAVESELRVYEYSTLKRLNDASVNYTKGSLHMSLAGYNTVDMYYCTLDFDNTTQLALIPESNGSYISAVHCNGKDVLVNKLAVSNDTEYVDIFVYSTLPSSEIKEYRLMQDSSVLQKSTTGVFNVDPNKVTLNKPLYVRIIKSDGTACTKIKTNITVTENEAFIKENFSVGSAFRFDVAEELPLIGGGVVSLNFGNVPIAIEKDGDTYRIGFGCNKDLLTNETAWFNYKKFIETQDKNLKKGINGYLASKFGDATVGLKESFDMQVYGYAEGTISGSGKVHQIGGRCLISINEKVNQEWQTSVWIIPAVVKFTAEAGIETVVSVGLDFDNAKIYIDSDFELTLPKLTLTGGVGIAYIADFSVYGSASNVVKFSTQTDTISASLNGEMGLSAKILYGTWKKTLLKGNWQYYHSGSALSAEAMHLNSSPFIAEMQDINNYEFDRSYVHRQSEWLDSQNAVNSDISGIVSYENTQLMSSALNTTKTLQTDIYYSANPQIVVTDSGLKMMVWTSDITTRTNGNHTAVVYSIYDDYSATWSEPIIIEDDGTADFYPSVATDGENVYVAWMNSKRSDFTEDVELSEVAASCEITVAEYSLINQKFTASRLTNNTFVDFSPVLAAVNGSIYLAWIENSQNDFLMLSGTNTIYYSEYKNGNWSNPSTYAYVDKPILDLNIGNLCGNAIVAYVLDVDGNTATSVDAEIYCGNISENARPITNNNVCERSIQFGDIYGSNALIWYSDGHICYTKDLHTITIIDGLDQGLSHQFRVINNNGSTVLLSIVNNESGSEINQYSIGETIGQPVQLTFTDKYISSFSAASYYGMLYVPHTVTAVDITSTSINESTDLCIMSIGELTNLKIDEISFDHSNVASNTLIPVEVTVRNIGTVVEQNIGITAHLDGITMMDTIYNVDLQAGETTVITILLPTQEIVNGIYEYTISATPKSGVDVNLNDNSKNIKLGYTDLKLDAQSVVSESAQSVLVTVKNLSCIKTMAMLYIREDNAEGNILASYYIGEIGAYESETVEINVDILPEIESYGKTLYFDILAIEEELYLADNYDYLLMMSSSIPGDLNGDSIVDRSDAIHLLYYSIFGAEDYPVNQECDYTNDGVIDRSDAIYLLYHSIFGAENYPLS